MKKYTPTLKRRSVDIGLALAIWTAVFSLFPHLTLSDPVTMTSQSLSKYINVTRWHLVAAVELGGQIGGIVSQQFVF